MSEVIQLGPYYAANVRHDLNPLLSLFLRGLGIVKCTFPLPIGFITAAGMGLIVFAFAAACLLSLKVRKIAPRELLVGE